MSDRIVLNTSWIAEYRLLYAIDRHSSTEKWGNADDYHKSPLANCCC